MVGKKPAAYSGLVYVVPEKAVVMSSCSSDMNQSFMTHQFSSKTECKHYGGGCSTKVTKTLKSSGFVDRRNGNQGHKEEVNYNSSFKFKDKILGRTTQYETQVKNKKVTTYSKPSTKSCRGNCNKVSTAGKKPGKSPGGVKIKTVTTCSTGKPSKSSGGSVNYCRYKGLLFE